MSEFVDECRREWKRLGVPDPIANEMAADLEADLAEAEAEGASAEDVLGSGAFDPRSFAASWAAERGVTQVPTAVVDPQPATPARLPNRWRMIGALAVFALIAVVGATLAVHRSVSEQVTLASPWTGPFGGNVRRIKVALGKPQSALPLMRLKAIMAQGPGIEAKPFAVQLHNPHFFVSTFGLILLLVGVGGFIVTLVYWVYSSRPRPAQL